MCLLQFSLKKAKKEASGQVLEPTLGSWRPPGASGGPSGEPPSCIKATRASRDTFSDPILGPIFALFRNFRLSGSLFFSIKFLSQFLPPKYPVLRSFLKCFFNVFFNIFLIKNKRAQCGFDSLFTMYKAHRNFSKNLKNYIFFTFFAVNFWTPFLEPFWSSFWDLFGSLWGLLGPQTGSKRVSENWSKN